MFLTAFYGLWVTYNKTVTRPNVTGFNQFWPVAVRLWVYYHIRQPVAVPVTQNWAEKPDLTGHSQSTCTHGHFWRERGVPWIMINNALALTLQGLWNRSWSAIRSCETQWVCTKLDSKFFTVLNNLLQLDQINCQV